jgi:hypothetical protein
MSDKVSHEDGLKVPDHDEKQNKAEADKVQDVPQAHEIQANDSSRDWAQLAARR